MIRIASIDDDMNLPDAVREKLAANLGDPSTPEGAELNATFVTAVTNEHGTTLYQNGEAL